VPDALNRTLIRPPETTMEANTSGLQPLTSP